MTHKKSQKNAYLRLLPSVLCIAVTMFAGLAAARAWFSMNDKVNASGMKVTLDTADAYLVITDSEVALHSADSSNVSVTYNEDSHDYVPVTHDSASSPYQLKYAKNGDSVDPNTGLVEGLEFNPVPAAQDNGNYYFAEFTVYIGALYCEMTGTDLIADWDSAALQAATNDPQKAASIDFYVLNDETETYEYVTSTNIASGQSVTLLSDTVIPATTSQDCISVQMRFYYDGALTYEKDGDTVAYIRTAEAVGSNVNLGISFRAETHDEP